MSWVTDLIFITTESCARKRFADLVERHHGFRPEPMENNGPKFSFSYVFNLGMNHVSFDMLDEMKDEPWPEGSVLYIFHGEVEDATPQVTYYHWLTSSDAEPEPGATVRGADGAVWDRGFDQTIDRWSNWTQRGQEEEHETWTKVAGNYGPVRRIEE